jgi:hypothetical protein
MSTSITTRTTTTTPKATAKKIARYVLLAERVLMGLFFVAFGLHGCFGGGAGDSTNPGAFALGGLLMKGGFLFPLFKGAELLLEQYLHAGTEKA